MPLAQLILYHIRSPLLAFLMVFIGVSISICGLLIVRRYISHKKLKTHNDIAGAIFGTLGMAYTVLLAFVMVVVWQNFNDSKNDVEREAACLLSLSKDAEPFEAGFKLKVRMLCEEYANTVISDEWGRISRGSESPAARDILNKFWVLYGGYEPKSYSEKVFFEESIAKLNRMAEIRQMRIAEGRTGIHPVLWFVLLAGAVATVSFTFFFGSENFRAQLIMASLLAAVISLILFMILSFDFPFTGDVSITPDPFVRALEMRA